MGEIQAIGGVNEKIEGFFEICAARGLTREQGVIIPAANQAHLMLHKDVRQAVKKGMFKIYVAEQAEDVMRLLTGLEPGKADARGNYPQKSFNYRVQQRIKQLQAMQKQFAHQTSNENSRSRPGK